MFVLVVGISGVSFDFFTFLFCQGFSFDIFFFILGLFCGVCFWVLVVLWAFQGFSFDILFNFYFGIVLGTFCLEALVFIELSTMNRIYIVFISYL